MRLATILIPAALILAGGLTLTACGQDSGTMVSSASDAAEGSGSELSAMARQCLDLVADGHLRQAVDPCTQAARELPDNSEVGEALAKARAAADQAASDAVDQAESWKKTGEALAE